MAINTGNRFQLVQAVVSSLPSVHLSPALGDAGGADAHAGDADAPPHAKATDAVALIVGSIGMPAAARFAESTGNMRMVGGVNNQSEIGVFSCDTMLLHILKHCNEYRLLCLILPFG